MDPKSTSERGRMKIQSIRIDNILSFKKCDLNSSVNNAEFNNEICLLIGPNGAGKSNFLEILNQCFSSIFFRRFNLNEELVRTHVAGTARSDQPANQAISPMGKNLSNLIPHRDTPNQGMNIRLELSLSDQDIANIKFIEQNTTELNRLISTYSGTGKTVPQVDTNNIPKIVEVSISIQPNGVNYSTSINHPNGDFIKFYLEFFYLIEKMIDLKNSFVSPNINPKWPQLSKTFMFIHAYRAYNAFTENMSIATNSSQQIEFIHQQIGNINTKTMDTNEPAVFQLTKTYVGAQYFEEIFSNDNKPSTAFEITAKNKLMKSINELLTKYIGLSLKFEKINPRDSNVSFYFVKSFDDRRISINELSSGEKAIVFFVFAVLGSGVNNGTFLIDEPEIHLHPQMHRAFLRILTELSDLQKVQFLLVTHSPLFINSKILQGIYRFSNVQGATAINYSPRIEHDEASLLRFFDFDNASKIFFANKVILVEGETDEYFFHNLVEQIRAKNISPNISHTTDQTIEVVNIKGKGKARIWISLLQKFGLKTYFIGDLDNVENMMGINLLASSVDVKISEIIRKLSIKGSKDGTSLSAAIDNHFRSPTSATQDSLQSLARYIEQRSPNYAKAVNRLKSHAPDRWRTVMNAICNLCFEDIFLLPGGELEDYLGLRAKGLPAIIDFFDSEFSAWLEEDIFLEKRNDLFCIMEYIFEDRL